MKCERDEKAQHRSQLLVDRGGTVVVEDEPRLPVAQRRLRDRGVSVSSKDALIESRYERCEELTLAHGPLGWSAHHLLGQLGEWTSEILLPVTQRPHYARRVTVDQLDETEQGLVRQAMSAVNLPQSHAFSRAASPASSRCREAPIAALTTISNIRSSPYIA